MRLLTEKIGRGAADAVEDLGYAAALLVESLGWLIFGGLLQQRVRLYSIVEAMYEVGVRAVPVVALLAFANGAMIALQGIFTLRDFGAEAQIIPGIALSVTREFGALIVGVVVAGRSGSAIAARIGTMQISQEIDALRVMGISPVRYLVAPVLIAMLLVMPLLTVLSNLMAILGGAAVVVMELNMHMSAYLDRAISAVTLADVLQGLAKSLVFASLIAVISSLNGFRVRGGSDELGIATTRSVVVCIGSVVIADMIFTFFLSRG